MNAIVLDDGKISIPKELREALGLKPGTVLEMQDQAGTLVAWKKVEPDMFEKWRGRGRLPAGANGDEYLRLIRDGDSR
ncbi:MAG: AbrB/MazE/SpoVT family DNA-binding domain-containing protein [Chloroflexi bacterium]|nr:AbrB/MazE/SpoVT family DNA-binding domain-containing protein [Chloroflexota bacterium]